MSQVDECADIIDVAVVGAGPAGQTAGLYAARAGLSTVVFGDPYESQLARAEIVENYPTKIEPLSGIELIELLHTHAQKFGAQFDTHEVRAIRREEDRFHLFTTGGKCYPAYAIVLAMGTKRRQLGVQGEAEFYGRGVAYCTICDGPLFRNRPVAVIGEGEEGAAAAMRMANIAESVDLIVPTPRLDAGESLLEQLRRLPNVTIVEGAKVTEIVGDQAGVSSLRLSVNGEQVERSVRGVFLELGLLPASSLAADLGVTLMEGDFIETGRFQDTNVAGIFAAGDITGHRARQTVISAGEGATAAVSAVDYIRSHGLGGDRKGLRTVQWGASEAAPPAGPQADTAAAPAPPSAVGNELLEYVQRDPALQQAFEAHQVDVSVCRQIRERRPQARVSVIASSWCADCRRNVPRLARLCEHLPEWEFRMYARESPDAAELQVQAVPTVVVFDWATGEELGRIIEDPLTGSYEAELLRIVGGESQ